jgi:O-methyltransferase domain/Dimerisation domain
MATVVSTVAELPASVRLHQLMAGHWVSQAIYVVAKLGVADHLAQAPQTVEALARAVNAHPRSLYRLMRALASVGLFTEVAPARYELTSVGHFLRSDVAGSLRGLALTVNEFDWQPWGYLLHSVKTGQPAFPLVHGAGAFEYLGKHSDAGRMFDEAMIDFVSQNIRAVMSAYDFASFRNIVDVGGGRGALMMAILEANPSTRGIIQDLPAVIEGASREVAARGLTHRCACIAGDFFQGVPAGGDAYILASIIHDWNDQAGADILRSCRTAMSDQARLLLVEMVIPPGDGPSFGKLLDLEMLVCFGGRERTEEEYRDLLRETGFEPVRIVSTQAAASVIEAKPA